MRCHKTLISFPPPVTLRGSPDPPPPPWDCDVTYGWSLSGSARGSGLRVPQRTRRGGASALSVRNRSMFSKKRCSLRKDSKVCLRRAYSSRKYGSFILPSTAVREFSWCGASFSSFTCTAGGELSCVSSRGTTLKNINLYFNKGSARHEVVVLHTNKSFFIISIPTNEINFISS